MSFELEIVTPLGTVVGTRVPTVTGTSVDRYLAIPYARPPVGELRWSRPEPVDPTPRLNEGRRVVIAPQSPSRLEAVMGPLDVEQSEDCLHLSVWAPSRKGKPRPVVIWLHGGAWQSGGGAVDWYHGEHLAAAGDLIVVGINYRLGPLGWLALPGVEPNLGLLDQELAIAWVIQNIEHFGGDPGRITIMGQSAGASSIACLLVRNERPARAIIQSTSLARGARTMVQASRLGVAYLEALRCGGVGEARKLSVSEVLAAQDSADVWEILMQEGAGRSMFAPVADGTILPSNLEQEWARAAGRSSVLIGHTRDEMLAFDEVPGARVDGSPSSSQDVFAASTEFWARSAAAYGGKAWTYRFDCAPSFKYRACHCVELPFVFGTLEAFSNAPMMADIEAAKAASLTREIQQTWTNFINGMDPAWTPNGPPRIFR